MATKKKKKPVPTSETPAAVAAPQPESVNALLTLDTGTPATLPDLVVEQVHAAPQPAAVTPAPVLPLAPVVVPLPFVSFGTPAPAPTPPFTSRIPDAQPGNAPNQIIINRKPPSLPEPVYEPVRYTWFTVRLAVAGWPMIPVLAIDQDQATQAYAQHCCIHNAKPGDFKVGTHGDVTLAEAEEGVGLPQTSEQDKEKSGGIGYIFAEPEGA